MISMIWAMDIDDLIGVENELPWHFKKDFDYFKAKTKNKNVIVGENTFHSIASYAKGKTVLPGRKIHVVTDNKDFKHSDVVSIIKGRELKSFITECSESDEEFVVIGGRSLYEQLLPVADKLYVTIINKDYGSLHQGKNLYYFPTNVVDRQSFETSSIITEEENGVELIFKEYNRIEDPNFIYIDKTKYNFLKQFQHLAEEEQIKHGTHGPVVMVKDIEETETPDGPLTYVNFHNNQGATTRYPLTVKNIVEILKELYPNKNFNNLTITERFIDNDVNLVETLAGGIIIKSMNIETDIIRRENTVIQVETNEKPIDTMLEKFSIELTEDKMIIKTISVDTCLYDMEDTVAVNTYKISRMKSREKIKAYFFTMKEAHDYIQYQKHNLNQPFVYVDYDGYGNNGDYNALRNLLLDLPLEKFKIKKGK